MNVRAMLGRPMYFVLGCPAAFLLGAVPFGLVLVRLLRGVDLRTIGSGNIGATNASRAFPPAARLPVFAAIYLLDAAKGFVPTFLGPAWTGHGDDLLAAVVLGACAVLGHCFSPFLGFKGGKGVATATGVLLALDALAVAIAVGVFGLVFALTRRVYLGSLALGLALAVSVVLLDPEQAFRARLPLSLLAILLAVFLFYTHRSNLRRAWGGEAAS